MKVSIGFTILLCALLEVHGVSTKVDFGEDSGTTTNSSKEDEDVEVKHTIVVSTKLKNSHLNRGIHRSEAEPDAIYSVGRREKPKDREDSGEIPIVLGYKAVETTAIRSPDSRIKPQHPDTKRPQDSYQESLLINRNIRDDYDTYPNVAINPAQWKPSSYFNNINWWSPDRNSNFVRRDRPNSGKIHRKLAEDATKEFYCRKCREMSGKGCVQSRSWIETTTANVKIDGKLAKLN